MSESANEPLELKEEPKKRVFSSRREELGDLLPDEIPFSLTRMEYHVLSVGQNNESRAGRNFSLGFLGSALIGLVALVTQVDWGQAFRQARLGCPSRPGVVDSTKGRIHWRRPTAFLLFACNSAADHTFRKSDFQGVIQQRQIRSELPARHTWVTFTVRATLDLAALLETLPPSKTGITRQGR